MLIIYLISICSSLEPGQCLQLLTSHNVWLILSLTHLWLVTRGDVTVSLVRAPLSLEDAGVVRLTPAINLKPNKPRLLQCLQHK